jgi:hypothetical protein
MVEELVLKWEEMFHQLSDEEGWVELFIMKRWNYKLDKKII